MFSIFKSLDVEAVDIMKTIQDLLWDAKLIDFMQVVDDDDIEISLVLQNGTPVPIQNLSAGQRCTAVFPLLLRIKRGPLVIDQPEDNLDNRHIADVIAPQFLEKKQTQQFIITSHNANLVVLTDAELIMHVDSDGSEGKIMNRGFLSCSSSPIKNSVLDVLDGGEAALLARQKKYGITR
jgi:energy-coupling factor transporter ATP-binding protein EcfA2